MSQLNYPKKALRLVYVAIFFLSLFFLFEKTIFAQATLERIDFGGPLFSSGGYPGISYRNYTQGDYNNDGFEDFIISDYIYPGDYTGGIYIFYGSYSPASATNPDFSMIGSAPMTTFGAIVDTADMNGDGIDDLIESSTYYNSSTGRIQIFFGGNDFPNTPDVVLYGSTVPTTLYFAEMGVGDVNGDGIIDLVASSAGYGSGRGQAYVYYGPVASGDVPDWTYTAPVLGTWYGNEGNVVDINLDGYDDIIATAPYDDTNYTNAGRVDFFLGSESGPALTPTYSFFGEYANATIGFYMGKFDLPTDSGGQIIFQSDIESERVYLFVSSPSFDGTITKIYNNPVAEVDNFTMIMANLGDLDNDGFSEFAANAYSYQPATKKGRVYVYKGGTVLPDSHTWVLEGDNNNDYFSGPIRAGDWNKNSWNDFFVLALGYPSGRMRGALYLYEIDHGNPAINIHDEIYLSTKEIGGSASDFEAGYIVDGVQWSENSNLSGVWNDCSAVDGSFDENVEDYTCDLSLLGEGNQTLYFRSIDQNGISIPESLFASDSFVLDTVAPTGSLIINNGDLETSSRNLVLSITGDDGIGSGVSEMMISEDPSFLNSDWIPFATPSNFTLSSNQAVKTVYIQFKDFAGNLSNTYSDEIILNLPNNGGSSNNNIQSEIVQDIDAPEIRILEVAGISNKNDSDLITFKIPIQIPVVTGKTEPFVKVFFKSDGLDVFSIIASETGDFSMTLLPFTGNSIMYEYYAQDKSQNNSTSKYLKFELIKTFVEYYNPQKVSTPSPEITLIPVSTEVEVEKRIGQEEYIYTVVDQHKNPLPETIVFWEYEQFISNAEGKVSIPEKIADGFSLVVKFKDCDYEGNVSGEEIHIEIEKFQIFPSCLIVPILFSLIGLGFILYTKKHHRKLMNKTV